jgi:hypothetical protein
MTTVETQLPGAGLGEPLEVFGVRERSHCLNVRAAPLPGGTGPERGVVVLECVDRFASQARSGHFLFDRCESLNCRHPEPPNPRIYCHNSNVKRLVLILLAAVVGGLADAAGASPDATRPSTSAVVMERSQIQQLVLRYAAEYGMDYLLLDALIRTESAYNPNAVSHKGAMGLMQLMPATARRLRVADPFDPEQNIRGGVAEFARLMERYSGRGGTGPGGVQRRRGRGFEVRGDPSLSRDSKLRGADHGAVHGQALEWHHPPSTGPGQAGPRSHQRRRAHHEPAEPFDAIIHDLRGIAGRRVRPHGAGRSVAPPRPRSRILRSPTRDRAVRSRPRDR